MFIAIDHESHDPYLDAALGDASTQHYFPVAEHHAIGLPEPVTQTLQRQA